MISEETARTTILEKVRPLPERTVPLSSWLDCFSAHGLAARLPLPAFDNSAMDGYAVVASSCAKGKRLRVTAEQPAGRDKQLHVSPGSDPHLYRRADAARRRRDCHEGR